MMDDAFLLSLVALLFSGLATQAQNILADRIRVVRVCMYVPLSARTSVLCVTGAHP